MNYSHRLTGLRAVLDRKQIDAVVISNLTNVRYLCAYTGTAGMAVVTADEAWFVTDFRYQAQAAQQVPAPYKVIIAEGGLWKEAAKILRHERAEHIGFESEHTSVAAFHDIEQLIKPARAQALLGAVEDLRLRKDDDELALIGRAAVIIDECFAAFCNMVKPGLTELEVSAEMTRQMQARGATGPSFETIVAGGLRGALPHGVASSRVLEAGDMVTLDMGAVLDGYCSDFTRTVCLGKPTREQQRIYELVWQAQAAACEALRPGLGCKAADAIARTVIEAAGLGAAFGHGLGHGVGMEIHEQPRLSRLGKGQLKTGMVVTCEPGIYIEGWGGVRIEDLLVITADGAKKLSHGSNPRKLMAL